MCCQLYMCKVYGDDKRFNGLVVADICALPFIVVVIYTQHKEKTFFC